MKYKDFEDYLTYIHQDEYTGCDDDAPDAFNEWVQDLDPERIIHLGSLYGIECKQAAIDNCLKAVEEGLKS